ncbi:MAG: FG-GAP repeat domain-containing protein, partial [Candidatus Hodarchaeales archaeon]
MTLIGRIYGLAIGDADNDGDIDIFAGNAAGRVYLIENRGQGAFGISPVGFDVGRNAYGLASGDIDRDGFLDLVVGDLDGEVEVIYGNGQGSFTRRGYAPIGMLNPLPLGVRGLRQRTVGHSAFGIGVADMNNDGFLDVLIGDGENALLYFEGSGTSGFELVATVTKGFSSPYGIATADYDADGDIDILLGSWGYPDQAPVGLFWNADIKQTIPPDDLLTISQGDRFRVYLLVIATTALSALGGTFYFIAKEVQQRRISWKDLVAEVWQIFRISISYAIGNIWHMKRRTFNLIIGFAIGAALISSFVHYQEAAPRVAIKDALAERDYEMIIRPGFPWQGHHLLENASKWLMNEPFIEHTEVVYHSMGLFGAHGLPHNYFFGISGFGAYSPPGILVSDRESVYVVNETYLDTVADQFNVQGDLKVDRETIVLSNQLVSQINETTGISLEVGSLFNFSIAGSAPQHPDIGPVYYGNFTPVELTNMKVGGI